MNFPHCSASAQHVAKDMAEIREKLNKVIVKDAFNLEEDRLYFKHIP